MSEGDASDGNLYAAPDVEPAGLSVPYAGEVRAYRAAIGAYFLTVGLIVGSWVTRIPEIQATLQLRDGMLGLVLLMSAVGALISMPLAGRLAPRLGTRRLARITGVLICAVCPFIALAPGPATLMLALAVYGASSGSVCVASNALAVHVEGLAGRPILSAFHGLFSLGCLLGASAASGLAALGVGPLASLVGAAALLMGVVLIAGRWLPEAPLAPATEGLSAPPRALLILGALAFLGLVGEGAMGDWSAVYLKRSLATTESLAALGFAAFSLGMTGGRFAGDRLAHTLGDAGLLRGGAALAAFGLGGALLLAHPAAAIVGFALVGLGLSNAVPILYRAAARVPGVAPVAGIATASTIGYLGFLAGPPAIGLASEFASLPVALALVVASVAVVAAGGGLVADRAGAETVELSPEVQAFANAMMPVGGVD